MQEFVTASDYCLYTQLSTVDAMLMQSSIWRLHNRRIEACATVDSTPAQSFIRRLRNHQINTSATVAYAIVDSALVKKEFILLCSR